jgi:hypothetical protein
MGIPDDDCLSGNKNYSLVARELACKNITKL